MHRGNPGIWIFNGNLSRGKVTDVSDVNRKLLSWQTGHKGSQIHKRRAGRDRQRRASRCSKEACSKKHKSGVPSEIKIIIFPVVNDWKYGNPV